MGLRERFQFVIDAWSWANYKPIYSDIAGMPHRRAFPEAAAMWVPPEDERRLAAYKLLAAYDQNQAGELAALRDGPDALDRREFGDVAMFVDTIMAHVLGREQHITVPGAEDGPADGQDEPSPQAARAMAVQERLREWAEDELLPMRVQQCERKAVTLGDGVYRLAWDPTKQRPTVRVTDPGFYFPVIGEDADGGEYPRRVHFAWELPEDPKRGLKVRLRRITYELDWIRPATAPGVDERSRPVRAFLATTEPVDGEDAGALPLVRGDRIDPGTGQIVRQYAWNDRPSPFTCYLTDATWLMEDLRGPVDVDTLPADRAVYATREDGEVLDRLDLLIDFIPVVHVPNTVPPAEEHWGQSSLAKVLQVFDELQAADTDSNRASATTGAPIVTVTGRQDTGEMTVRPGMMIGVPEGGRMDALDTSAQLHELRDHVTGLRDRASTVARLPAVALGTLDPTKVPSGFALQLSYGPMDALISSMRLARDHKYRLLLKFVQRLFVAGQHPDWPPADILPAALAFGPYTPTDRTAVLADVALAVEKGVMSLETAVRMLVEAGFPVDDAEQEIDRIQSRQFDKARALADATGDQAAVGAFLGLDLDAPPAPAPVLPPVPGDNPDQPREPNSDRTGGSTEQ